MTFSSPQAKREHVRSMFTAIAPRYDLMNRVMTGWQDQRWRAAAARAALLPPGGLALDLGAGTGDLALAVLREVPSARVVALDFSPAMLSRARGKLGNRAHLAAADALALPFPASAFHAVLSGFVLRNLADLEAGLGEMARVTRPGGRVVSLEVARPGSLLVRVLHRLYFHGMVPLLGALLTGSYRAYRYLPQSLEAFVDPEGLEGLFRRVGLEDTGFRRLALGGVVVHWGVRP